VSVRYSAHDLGASPQYSQVLTEVFEVNLRETKSLLDLDCFEYEGAGGVVGGWDYSYRSRSRLSCSWKSELQDLFCVEHAGYRAAWGRRSLQRGRLLGAMKVLPSSEPEPAGPTSIEDLIRTLLPDPIDTSALAPVRIPGLGDTVVLKSYQSIAGRALLLGAPGIGGRMNARLFAALLSPSGKIAVNELHPQVIGLNAGEGQPMSLHDEAIQPFDPCAFGECEFEKLNPTVAGTRVERATFSINDVFENEQMRVMRIVATEGTARVLYLVGAELRQNKAPFGSALQLASTAPYFIHGRGAVKDAGITSFSLSKGHQFGVRVKVYPAIPLKSQQSDEDGIVIPGSARGKRSCHKRCYRSFCVFCPNRHPHDARANAACISCALRGRRVL
jgi:hypothetical protein